MILQVTMLVENLNKGIDSAFDLLVIRNASHIRDGEEIPYENEKEGVDAVF